MHDCLWWLDALNYRSIRLCSALNRRDRHSQLIPFSQDPSAVSTVGFISSGTSNSLRSGSSPYQKIHSSLDVFSDNGGNVTEFCARASYKLLGNVSIFFVEIRRQTHKIFSRKHLAYDRRMGSLSGSVIGSTNTNFRHRMPHKSVQQQKKTRKIYTDW